MTRRFLVEKPTAGHPAATHRATEYYAGHYPALPVFLDVRLFRFRANKPIYALPPHPATF